MCSSDLHARSALRCGAAELSLERRELTVRGERVPVSRREFAVLELLFLKQGTILNKTAFLNHLYCGADEPEIKTIDVIVCRLRKKLASAGVPDLVDTVWGSGYILREPSMLADGVGEALPDMAAMAMAWYHTDLYHRVLSYSGTYVYQQWPYNAETPHGAWEFHDTIIPNSPKKPLRIWMHVADRDNLITRDAYHDWVLANERMAKVLAELEPQPEALAPLEGPLREVVLWASETGRMHLSLRAQTVVRGIRQNSSHDLADALPSVSNFHVAAREFKDDIIFLHKVVEGRSDRSYGIQVARLAGLPAPVVRRASDILKSLEQDEMQRGGRPSLSGAAPVQQQQLGLFHVDTHPVIDRLRDVDVDRLAPLDALNLLAELKRSAGEDR